MLYVSSYCYICVLILLYMCPHTAMCVLILLYVSSYCYIVSSYYYVCVLILLYICPHTAIYVSSLLHMCPHTSIRVLILLYNLWQAMKIMREHLPKNAILSTTTSMCEALSYWCMRSSATIDRLWRSCESTCQRTRFWWARTLARTSSGCSWKRCAWLSSKVAK